MYYREEVINGVLCAQLSPKGEFRPLSAEALTRRLLIAESACQKALETKEELLIALRKATE